MKVFRPARDASSGRNLAKTALQTSLFWAVFLAALPNAIAYAEAQLGVPGFAFAGQRFVAIALFAAMAALNLGSGYTMAVIGRGTPFPADTARELVVRGPYRYVRNPMAVGGLGLGAAVAVYLGSYGTVVYVVAGGVLWNAIARPMEEADLAARFGEPYARYQAAVRCWLPRWRPYRP